MTTTTTLAVTGLRSLRQSFITSSSTLLRRINMSATKTTTASASTITIPGARTVKGKINYLDRSVTKPFQYLYPDRPAGEPENNFVFATKEVDVTDLHGTSDVDRQALGFNTREAGFEIVDGWGLPEQTPKEWKEEKWENDEWIQQQYYADTDALVKQRLGATSTFIFDHTVRKRRTRENEHLTDDPQNRKPVAQAHCDQSRWAGEERIRKHLGPEILSRVKSGELHAQLVNVWRPLRGPVFDTPLAVADSRTVSRGEEGKEPDWKESELKYKGWSGQTLAIHPNEGHRWYYHSQLETNQAIFLKCYDSVTETRTPHTAFEDPTTPQDAPPRWSVELRVLVITDPSKKATA